MQKLLFFGSDQYSAVVLTHLLENLPHADLPGNRDTGIPEYVTVITDKRSDPLPVEQLATKHGLEIYAYPELPEVIEPGTIGLCASFDHLLPGSVIDRFGGNLYNLHPSLLPQYRNVSPVQYSLALGDKVTGITLFRISTGIDNGEIIAQTEETILETDTTPTLTPRLFEKGADLFLQYIFKSKKLERLDKLDGLITLPVIFTHRLTRDSGYIEWPVLQKLLNNKPIKTQESANELVNLRLQRIQTSGLIIDNWLLVLNDLLRALTPWPGIWSIVPTKKGDLRISIVPSSYAIPHTPYSILISGKPRPISLTDFLNNYL